MRILSLEELSQLIEYRSFSARTTSNPDLKIEGVLLTMLRSIKEKTPPQTPLGGGGVIEVVCG